MLAVAGGVERKAGELPPRVYSPSMNGANSQAGFEAYRMFLISNFCRCWRHLTCLVCHIVVEISLIVDLLQYLSHA